MQLIEKLPSPFQRYQEIGGVLDFAVFENVGDANQDIFSAIRCALPSDASFYPGRLNAFGYKRIERREFFGDWYDLDAKKLIQRGSYTTEDGLNIENPLLEDIEDVKIRIGGFSSPDPGVGGQFGYAFLCPPHGMIKKCGEIQSLFDQIVDFIIPVNVSSEILDWTDPRLPEVSDYFEGGMEWWGVFLFSIFVPELQRLTIIVGSTTD